MGIYVEQEKIDFELKFFSFDPDAKIPCSAIIGAASPYSLATLSIPSFTGLVQDSPSKLSARLPGKLQPVQKVIQLIAIYVGDPVEQSSGRLTIYPNGLLEIAVFPDSDFPGGAFGQGWEEITVTYHINPHPI